MRKVNELIKAGGFQYRKYYPPSCFDNITWQVVIVSDMSNPEKCGGLIVSIPYRHGIEKQILDYDEIKDLVSTVKVAMNTLLMRRPATTSDYIFDIKDRPFAFVFHYQDELWQAFMSNQYHNTVNVFHDYNYFAEIQISSINTIIQVLNQALMIIDSECGYSKQ